MENAASKLTELSRKEDCDVVQNLIMTVQDRYRKLHQRTTERAKTLEEVKKRAKQVRLQAGLYTVCETTSPTLPFTNHYRNAIVMMMV